VLERQRLAHDLAALRDSVGPLITLATLAPDAACIERAIALATGMNQAAQRLNQLSWPATRIRLARQL
jgi:hypothetical protein